MTLYCISYITICLYYKLNDGICQELFSDFSRFIIAATFFKFVEKIGQVGKKMFDHRVQKGFSEMQIRPLYAKAGFPNGNSAYVRELW